MKKYYLGELHGRNGEKDKIYYSWKTREFIAIKKDGVRRNLSKKQERYLYKKFHIKCDWITGIGLIKNIIIAGIIAKTILFSTTYGIQYRNILEDLPKLEKEYCFDEKVLKKERDIEFLVSMCMKYIDKNDNYTDEQKEYLKAAWKEYLEDEGELFERKAILDMLQNISSVPIEYKPYENNGVFGRHENFPHKIILYTPYAKNADLLHETQHCAIGTNLSGKFIDLEEGYCGAVEGKYGDNLTYVEENENLLIMSEIIVKEKLKYYIINGKKDELIAELANKTHTNKKEIRDLIAKMHEYKYTDFLTEEGILKRETLNKEIKRELAELAIKADGKNKENFIVLNAYYDKYVLETSFLENEYYEGYFYNYDEFNNYSDRGFVARIDESNKYDYVYLFEEELTRTKSKNK